MKTSERIVIAYNYASEKTKQMIALSTAIIGVSVSFSKDIFVGLRGWCVLILLASWVLYLLSIWFGVSVLGRIAGRLRVSLAREDLNNVDIVTPARKQTRLFLCALALTVIFGFASSIVLIIDAGGLSKSIPKSK